jgi:hypothetical protein
MGDLISMPPEAAGADRVGDRGLRGFEGDFKSLPFHFEDGDAVLLHEVYKCANFFDVHGR